MYRLHELTDYRHCHNLSEIQFIDLKVQRSGHKTMTLYEGE
jgi:hypothetical protein